MKLRYIFLSLLTLLSASFFPALSAVSFVKSSRLSSGKWVKIGVEKTGVYEISYQTLREMGFSNPENITLYGRGGVQESLNFFSAGGSQLYNDDLQEVPVLHHGNKVYFYGQGTEDFSFTLSSLKYECGGYFSRKSKNIYADKGYYFISDTGSAKKMAKTPASNVTDLKEVTSGVGRYAHEIDLVQNNSNTGQLFFGEKVTQENPRIQWDVFLPDALSDKKGALECYFYVDREIKTSFSYGLEGTSDPITGTLKASASTNFTPSEPHIGSTTVPGPQSTVFFHCDPEADTDVSHVDYWTLTYPKSIPTLTGKNGERLSQDFIAFPLMERNKSSKIKLEGGAGNLVLDISQITNPVQLETVEDGPDAWVKITYASYIPQLVIFDPIEPQMQISGYQSDYTQIANQDLHSKLAEGAELLIICIPALRETAEKLADLHRTYDGIKVVVATTNECYNEFSSGVPDPMAYRAAVKLAYQSDFPCKNLLLMGPLFGDFRGIVNEKQPEEGIIAYQATPMNQLRGAQNANCFYGIMSDYISTNIIENTKVDVGVGVLPIRYAAEGETVIEKIRQHLELSETDIATHLNFYTAIGGVGDKHTHDNQATRSTAYLNNFDNFSTICDNLIIDAYGYKEAQRKFFNDLNSGRFLVSYFGHGAEYTLNKTGDFFYASDVYKLRNRIHPIMIFAGCELSNSDRGVRGMGENMVTSTPYGMLGTILATRETWAGQNEDLVKLFQKNLYRNGSATNAPAHIKPITIGEVWARTLTQSTNNNELAYQLVCDPAIVLPVVTRPTLAEKEIFDGVVGEFLEFSCSIPVSNSDKTLDRDYNGKAVVRLIAPIQEILSADRCSADDDETHDFKFKLADTQLSMTSADVVNGVVNVKLFVPETAKKYIGQTGRIHIATYSGEQKIATGNLYGINFNAPDDNSNSQPDHTIPVINLFEYNPARLSLEVAASDNRALAFANLPLAPSFKLTIDGRDYEAANAVQPVISDNGAAMTRSIPLSDLSEGSHSAKVTVADAAGNTASAEISFEYLPYSSAFSIVLEEGAVKDNATFSIVGKVPAEADIIIMDQHGVIIRRDNISGTQYEWDGCDYAGYKVEKGLYKAYLLETGNKSGKGHSSIIPVPVI